jgi:hypothetical protein
MQRYSLIIVNVKNKRSSDMDKDTQVEVVNICIVNALRIDEDHRMMILEKLTQNLTDENRDKLLRLLNVVGRSEQLKCEHKGRRTATELVEYCEDCKKILFHP